MKKIPESYSVRKQKNLDTLVTELELNDLSKQLKLPYYIKTALQTQIIKGQACKN